MAKKSSLGRGIDSIFLDNAAGGILIPDEGRIYKLPLLSVEPRADQPRKHFDEDALRQLSDSISVHGVIQPILVTEVEPDRYSIIAGERRWRAAKLAGLREIPAIILDSDEMRVAEISLIENIQRENLNPYEEAQAYRALISQFSLTQEELSSRIGKSRSAIANTLRLLDLPDSVIVFVKSGELSAGHARALLSLRDPYDIPVLADRIIEKGLSVRAAEAMAKSMNSAAAKPETDDVPAAPAVDYVKLLEDRAREALGRPVTIVNKGKKRKIEIGFEDDRDLEALLTALCGNITDSL